LDTPQALLPHLDAAVNLASYLVGNEHDAQDIVQESVLRAMRSPATCRGGNVRAWLLAIVRNACFDSMRRKKVVPFEPIAEDAQIVDQKKSADPAKILQQAENVAVIRSAIAKLSPELRESIVLREMEGLPYRDIADVTGVPIGTVMSRLARARKQLAEMIGG